MKNSKSDWLYIAPIRGLVLSEIVNNEFKIGNVLFVSQKKLPRIRKRIGIPIVISEFPNLGLDNPKLFKEQIKNFFKNSKTYAVVHFSGTPAENRNNNIRLIEEAIDLFAFSNLGFNTRKFNKHIEIKSSEKSLRTSEMIIDKNKPRFTLGNNIKNPISLEIDKRWKTFHNSFFYIKFIDLVINNKSKKSKWTSTLKSVGKILGASINTHNIPQAFLNNIIALEMLLTTSDDKIVKKLVERTEFLIGWNEEWENQKIYERIPTLYKKRNDFVHDGKTDEITIQDLIFTDDLVFNIVNNLIKSLNKITSKAKLIEYSNKYQCEVALQLKTKSKYQLGSFQYLRKRYNKEEIIQI